MGVKKFRTDWERYVNGENELFFILNEPLGVSTHSLYAWCKKYGKGPQHAANLNDQQAEIKRLRAELKRVTEERDILKKATAYFAKESR